MKNELEHKIQRTGKTLTGVKIATKNRHILNIGDPIVLLKWSNDKIETLCEIPFMPVISANIAQVQFISDQTIFFAIEEKACYILDLTAGRLELKQQAELNGDKAPCLSKDTLFFYKKGYPEGFSKITPGQTKKETFQGKPAGMPNFSRSFVNEDLILFAGTHLVAFDISGQKPSVVYNIKSDIERPLFALLEDSHALMFETAYNDSSKSAINILNTKTGTIVKSYRKSEYLVAFDKIENELATLTKKGDKYFLSQFEIANASLKQINQRHVSFDTEDDVAFVQKGENTFLFIGVNGVVLKHEF